MPDLKHVRYSEPATKVARIVLDRPEARNAQNVRMLYELNSAFDRAAADDDISVIILAAEGKHFSAGHDLRELDLAGPMSEWDPVGTWCGSPPWAGSEGRMAQEKEALPRAVGAFGETSPSRRSAEVQGKVISGGLMLVWPCDLIVASEDAEFADNTVAMGGERRGVLQPSLGARAPPGQGDAVHVRFHRCPDRLPARHGQPRGSARRALRLRSGPRRAHRPQTPFALKLAKEAVNAAQDAGRPHRCDADGLRAAPAMPYAQPGPARSDRGPRLLLKSPVRGVST